MFNRTNQTEVTGKR